MEIPKDLPEELKVIANIYKEMELSAGWDEEDILNIVIRDGFDVNKFVPIAIEVWENLSDLEAPQSAVIINESGDRSSVFQFNTDSELKHD